MASLIATGKYKISRAIARLTNIPRSIKLWFIARFLEARSSRSGIKIALYDPKTDILRFPEPREGMMLLEHGIIADAVPWMLKVNQYYREGGIVFDVGGFRGVTAQWFSRRARQVYVFEPMPENALSIRTVLTVRNIKNVSVETIALSDAPGTKDFHIYAIKGHNSLGRVDTSKYLKTIQVPVSTLDEFSRAHRIDHIDFLKIDVEGFELEVLRGARRLLSSKKIGAILFEANRPVLRSLGKTAAPIYELLASFAYRITDLDGNAATAAQVDQCEFGDFLARPTTLGK